MTSTLMARLANLPDELIREIIDHIEADPEKLVNLDRRAYLSQESFKAPTPPRDESETIGNFRLTCRRFSKLGAIHQFARVTTRFSHKGLRRLENIAAQAHLAQHVRKFSYMVPYFYVADQETVHQLLPDIQRNFGSVDVKVYDQKVSEQKQIVENRQDVQALQKAASAFLHLNHVQILRVQDGDDEILIRHLRRHNELTRIVELNWVKACSHSTKTLGTALLESKSPCSRFSSPMLSPQSAQALASLSPGSFKSLAQRLTSLELHFDDGADLDNRMLQLSSLFKVVFTAASNMQAVHIGFPSHRPLSLRLEDLFHNIKWDKLSAFGIQAWKLDADEIINLVARHRERLRGLRLRDVLLKENSMWKDVLAFLRDDMPYLDWVSLRRIGYAKHFDEQWGAAGVEVPDDLPGGASDSDEDSDTEEPDLGAYTSNVAGAVPQDTSANNQAEDDDEDESDAESSVAGSEDSEDRGPRAHEMDFPQLAPDTPSSAPFCTCNNRQRFFESADQIGDDGVFVSNSQRKAWEKWVLHRCPEHMSAK